MTSSALHKLQSFHQELYQHALGATHHIFAMNTAEISAYSKNFYASLPKSFSYSSLDQLTDQIKTAQFMLFGDFHTLLQSQRGFLRILRQISQTHAAQDLMVALEIFCAEDQGLIDEFLANKISEATFLEKIDYHNKWGFPWEHYQPIIAFCKLHKIRIAGINSQFNTPNSLILRDSFAAEILNRWTTAHPDQLCLCLIGEYHLADRHLLAHITPHAKTIRVVNNIDDYYFSSNSLPTESTEYLQLAQDFFCVLNTAPWIKWQSLAFWEELHSNKVLTSGEDYDPYTEQHYDFDYQLLRILKDLNQFMNLDLDGATLSQFNLYIRPDRDTLDHIKTKLKVSRSEFNTIEQRINSHGIAYRSASCIAIINDLNINRFTEIAGYYLYDKIRQLNDDRHFSLLERIERQICGTITSLIMNPRKASKWPLDFALNRASQLRNDQKLSLLLYHELIHRPERVWQNLVRWEYMDQEHDLLISRQTAEIIGHDIFCHIIEEESQHLEENLRQTMQFSLPKLLERWVVKANLQSVAPFT